MLRVGAAEQPQPCVWLGVPYASMNRSFTIAIVSDAVRSLQLLPNTLSVEDASAYPLDSMKLSVTPPVELPCRYQPPMHPPPNV